MDVRIFPTHLQSNERFHFHWTKKTQRGGTLDFDLEMTYFRLTEC